MLSACMYVCVCVIDIDESGIMTELCKHDVILRWAEIAKCVGWWLGTSLMGAGNFIYKEMQIIYE